MAVTVDASCYAKIVPNIFSSLGTAASYPFGSSEGAYAIGNASSSSNVTIPSGSILTVYAGKTLSFSGGARLVMNGSLQAVGTASQPVTFDFGNPNSSTNNGIQLSSSSGASTISYCQVRNASCGISENGVSVNISNSAISNCTNGIALSNNSRPTLTDNYIHEFTGYGLDLNGASPVLFNNYIKNTTAGTSMGVHCINSSNPVFGSSSQNGYNQVTGCQTGLYCWNNSLPVLGQDPTSIGWNDFVNTYWNVSNMTGNGIYAHENWWGSSNPANFKVGGTGSVLTNNYKTSFITTPNPPPLSKSAADFAAAPGAMLPMLGSLDSAYQLVAAKRLTEARGICLNLVRNYPTYTVAYNALNLLKDTFLPTDVASARDLYVSIFNSPTKCDLYAMAGLIAAGLDKSNALSLIDNVISKYQGFPVIELALYDKVVLFHFDRQDASSARGITGQLDALFPGSQGAFESHRLLGDPVAVGQDPSLQKNLEAVVSEYALEESYPNPFNPSTTLRFALPKDANLRLAVYDVLGREVVRLADGFHQAGYHSVTWNAQNAASGLYFARLTVNELGKMVYTKTNRLLLTK